MSGKEILKSVIDLGAQKVRGINYEQITKGHPPPTLFKDYIEPDFNTPKQWQLYFGAEKEKWINGTTINEVFFPGSYYYFLTQQWIKDRHSGKIFRPSFRWCDLLMHQHFHAAREKEMHTALFKGRGQGLSVHGGAMADYYMSVFPGTTSLITSKDSKAIQKFFLDKVLIPFERKNPYIRPAVITNPQSMSNVSMRCEVKFRNPDTGLDDVNVSELYLKETSEKPDSPNNFSGTGAIYAFLDEIFLHSRREDLLKSIKFCLINPETKKTTGWMLLGGSIEETVANDKLLVIFDMIRDAALYNVEPIFIPFWMNSYCSENNGFPDKIKALREWDKEAEKFDKSSDRSLLNNHKKQYPRSLEDIFDLAQSGRFEADVEDKIHLQIKSVRENPPQVDRVKLIERENRIEKVGDKDGLIHILENPIQGVQYVQTIDNVTSGTETGNEKGSNFACIMNKLADPQNPMSSYSPVSYISWRPDKMEQAYRLAVNQFKYYNMYGGMECVLAEKNSDAEHLSSAYVREGLTKYIEKTKDLSGKGNVNTKKIWQHIGEPERIWQMRHANIFLRKRIEAIKMLPLLEDMIKPVMQNKDNKVNTDLLDAWLMFMIFLGPDFDSVPKAPKPKPKREIRVFNRNKGVFEFIEV